MPILIEKTELNSKFLSLQEKTMNSFSLIDPTFDVSKAENYHLALQISPFGYSFAVLDTVWKRYVVLKHEQLNPISDFEKVLNSEIFFDYPYKSVSALFLSSKSIVVPSQFFDKHNESYYLSFTNTLSKEVVTHHKYLKKTGAYLVFTIPELLVNQLNKRFEKVNLTHQLVALIENSLHHSLKKVEPKVAVCVYDDFFDMIVTCGSQLLHHNSFAYQSQTDILYYIALLYKQLKLSPENVLLDLYGNITLDSSLKNELSKFILTVRFKMFEKNFDYSDLFNDVPKHYFVNLLNLYSCE